MTIDQLMARMIGRTITDVGLVVDPHHGALGIEWVDLDSGDRLTVGVGDGTLEHPWVEVAPKWNSI